MKRQIKQNVYETNSSSVHTLTLRSPKEANDETIREMFDTLPTIVKEHIKANGLYFGRMPSEYEYSPYYFERNNLEMPYAIEIMNFELKLHELLDLVMLSSDNMYTLVKIVENIKKIADTLGVDSKFNFDLYKDVPNSGTTLNELLTCFFDIYNLASYILDVECELDIVERGEECDKVKEGYVVYTEYDE